MLQNPHHYPWRHAPSLVQDCPTGANRRRKGVAGGVLLHGRGLRGADKHRWGIADNDKGTPRAASSQARLVADKALHPIGKLQPQLITCNPP